MERYLKLLTRNWYGLETTVGLTRAGRQNGAVTLVVKQGDKDIATELTEFDRRKIIEWLSK